MSSTQPAYSDFVFAPYEVDLHAEARTFDRMMFDICGEVNHICKAHEQDGVGMDDALRAFDRSCGRVYSSPDVSEQRKFTLRSAEWILKSWCEWNVPGVSKQTATRWFDSWQHERNMALLQL